jgi:hypothetical protein
VLAGTADVADDVGLPHASPQRRDDGEGLGLGEAVTFDGQLSELRAVLV